MHITNSLMLIFLHTRFNKRILLRIIKIYTKPSKNCEITTHELFFFSFLLYYIVNSIEYFLKSQILLIIEIILKIHKFSTSLARTYCAHHLVTILILSIYLFVHAIVLLILSCLYTNKWIRDLILEFIYVNNFCEFEFKIKSKMTS